MSTPCLYGVGVGPGASDLMTFRAVEVLKSAPVLALPRANDFGASMAWRIAQPLVGDVPGQERLFLTFPMNKDPERLRPAWERAFEQIGARLEKGLSVAFVAEGDPSLFSSFIYLQREAPRRWPGVRVEVVPGVSSVMAVPAVTGVPLADGQERVAIIPANYGVNDLVPVLEAFDTTVLMKIGREMPNVIAALERTGLTDRAVYVSKATLPEQRVVRDVRSVTAEYGDCFGMVVAARKERSGVLAGDVPETDRGAVTRVGAQAPQPEPQPEPRSEPKRAPRRPFAIYAITRHGVKTAEQLVGKLPEADLFVSEKLLGLAAPGAKRLPLPMGPLLQETFIAYDCHVFVISVGAVVRMVAPLLKNKKVDPAVLCVDDANRFTICVLSGHVGRGNAFTERVAASLGNEPVITTASDAIGTLTVDILGRELGWTLDDPDRNVTRGCAAVVNAAPVLFIQEAGEANWWPLEKPLPEGVRYTTTLEGVDPAAYEMLLIASDRELQRMHPAHWANAVIYRPKSLVLGIGCDRDTPVELMARGIDQLLAERGLSKKAVAAVATIDKKKDEQAILAACERNGWPLLVYSAEELDAVPGIENPSSIVQKHVGTRGVAEPAALKAAGASGLVVPKQIYTEPGAGRSMTFAVARRLFAPRQQEVSHG